MRRGGTEVAPQRATHRGDEGGRGREGVTADRTAHGLHVDARLDPGMAHGPLRVLAQKTAEPVDPLAEDNPVRVDALLESRDTDHVAAHHDRRLGLVLSHQPAHLGDLQDIGRNGADPDHIVLVVADLADEAVQGGEIQQHAGGLEIGLNHHQPPRAIEHPQGKRTLHPRHLVVPQFHGVDLAAAELVVLGKGPEHARQQHPGPRSQGKYVRWLTCNGKVVERNTSGHVKLLFSGDLYY